MAFLKLIGIIGDFEQLDIVIIRARMLEIGLLSVALSMDVLAVSIGLGVIERAKFQSGENRKRFLSVFVIAFHFAAFHALFPLLGYLGGVTLFSWLDGFSQWFGSSILFILGLKAIYDSLHSGSDEDVPILNYPTLLILALATSIDAFAIGFTLPLLAFPPLLSCLVIGMTTLIFSLFGLFVGSTSSERFAPISSLLGGIILIAIGFKILLL